MPSSMVVPDRAASQRSDWVIAICSVLFDLDVGQRIDSMYPEVRGLPHLANSGADGAPVRMRGPLWSHRRGRCRVRGLVALLQDALTEEEANDVAFHSFPVRPSVTFPGGMRGATQHAALQSRDA